MLKLVLKTLSKDVLLSLDRWNIRYRVRLNKNLNFCDKYLYLISEARDVFED